MKRANLILMAALAAAGLTTVTGALVAPAVAVAADNQKAAQKLGPKIAKPLRAAQDAIAAKNWDEASARLVEAAAVEPKTPYEAFMVDELGWFVMVQRKDYQGAVDALTRAVASGFYAPEDLPRRYKALAQLSYELKQYPKTVEYGKKALELAPASDDMKTLVAMSMYLIDDFAGARTFSEQVIAGMAKPSEQLLQINLRCNYELNDRAGTKRALEGLVRNYPAQKYWKDLLANQLYETKSDRDLRALYRLMADTNSLAEPDEYSEMAAVLLTGGYPNEAKTILERGLAANVFKGDTMTRAQAELQRARAGADTDRKDLPGADAALAAAKAGNEMVALGKLFFSSAEYAKAADAFRKGIAKGGVTDVDDANTLLGIALARGGQGAAAMEAFGLIKDPKLGEIGRLWKLHVETSTQAAAAPAPAG